MKNVIFLLIISAVIGFTASSCGDDRTESSHFHYEWIFDTTDTLNIQSVEQILNYHKPIWGLNGQGEICPHRITVTVTGIDQTSRQIQKTFELPEKPPIWEYRKIDRLEAQKKFLGEIRLYVDFFLTPRPESKYSMFMRNLAPPLERLSKSNADYRYLYVFSDGLQNNPKTVSFYSFREKPERLIEPVVYDSLSTILKNDITLPPLDGIEILIVGVPRWVDDNLSFYANKFWIRFYNEQGALRTESITNF